MDDQTTEPSWLELERVIGLEEVERLTTLSPDTVKRRYPNLVVKLSPRRVGMKMRSALAIAGGTAA